jgi:hypothetical protein
MDKLPLPFINQIKIQNSFIILVFTSFTGFAVLLKTEKKFFFQYKNRIRTQIC